MKILMVTPFSPLRDGVGKYAAEEVRMLRDEGHEVEILAPVACAAHHVENFKSYAGGLAKLRGYARRYDRVILQYQPSHFHWKSEGPARIATNFWMMVAFRTIRNLEIVCHEIEYPAPAWNKWRPEKTFDRWAWAGARHVEFHTKAEIEQMRDRLGVVPRGMAIREHSRFFRPAVNEDTQTARRRLKLPPNVPIFVCVGFIQPHKGFDRAIRAFHRISGDARLYIVGSVSTGDAKNLGYIDELHYLAGNDERVTVLERALSDDEFDRWILSSNAVLLPYREIWSSAVFERARVLKRPVIASAVGGLGEQLRPDDILVANDSELAQAIAKMIGDDATAVAQPLTVSEAMAYVTAEARRRGALRGTTPIDRALYEMDAAGRIELVTLSSPRRYVGRVLDILKKVMRRGLGWVLMPLLGQINQYHRYTREAMRAIAESERQPAVAPVPEDASAVRHRAGVYAAELGRDGPIVIVASPASKLAGSMRDEGLDVRETTIEPDLYLSQLSGGELAGIVVSGNDADVVDALVAAARRAVRPRGTVVIEIADASDTARIEDALSSAGFVDVERRAIARRAPRPPLDAPDAPAWAQRMMKSLDAELDAINERLLPPVIALFARAPA